MKRKLLIIIPVLVGLMLGAFIYSSNVKSSVKTGDMAPNIIMPGGDNAMLELQSLRGHYVLVDFWASWCLPCRKENINLARAYTKYKNQKLNGSSGFTIFSVSLDTDREVWKKAIKNDKLIWPYHVTDLKKWETKSVNDYGITAIPANFLLDPSGKIIATDLTGILLETELEKLVVR